MNEWARERVNDGVSGWVGGGTAPDFSQAQQTQS